MSHSHGLDLLGVSSFMHQELEEVVVVNIHLLKHSLGEIPRGPAEHFEEYLIAKRKISFDIESHPLSANSDLFSTKKVYLADNGEFQESLKRRRLVPPLGFFFDFFVFPRGKTAEIAIVFDPLAGLLVLLKRNFRYLVYWGVDFLPVFSSKPVRNFIYSFIEKIVIRKCRILVENNPYAAEARVQRTGVDSTCLETIIIPISASSFIPAPSPIEGIRLGYIGTLNHRNGAHRLIALATALSDLNNQFRFDIIGSGPLHELLKFEIESSALTEHVFMHGFMNDEDEINQILDQIDIGLAPYPKDEESFTTYADPGKLAWYGSRGLYSLVSDAPKIVDLYEKEKRLMVLKDPFDSKEWAQAINSLYKAQERLYELKVASLACSRNNNYSDNFDEFLRRLERVVVKEN